eukprot:jgi/Antlo1/82/1361
MASSLFRADIMGSAPSIFPPTGEKLSAGILQLLFTLHDAFCGSTRYLLLVFAATCPNIQAQHAALAC